MVELSISEISKHPKILEELREIAKVVNKKSRKVRGIFVPLAELDEELIKEIEYRLWLRRNAKGLSATSEELKGLGNEALRLIGERL
jgi:hypothetical protein